MTDPLSKLFGSAARVKLLRLFLFNPKESFTPAEAAVRARSKESEARREIKLFNALHLVKRARRLARSRGPRFILNEEFEYTPLLQQLLLNARGRGDDVYKRIHRTGTLKLVVLSGIFTGEWDAALDVLVVGERINEKKLRGHIRRLESEIGKELRYASLGSDEFFYRLNMNDHLIRDVLDYPHRIVLDKLNIGLR